MTTERLTLLSIGSEQGIRRELRSFFEESGFEVQEADTWDVGLAVLRKRKPGVILVDLKLPGISGLQVIGSLVEEAPETPVVVIADGGALDEALEAIRLGASDLVIKPIADMRQLLHVVNRALEEARLREANRWYGDQLAASKIVESALRESEEKFRDLVENINDVVFAVDIDGGVTYVSPVVENITGFRPDEIIGRHYREFFRQEDRPGLDERQKSILEGNTESHEYQTCRKSGELLWLRTSGRPMEKAGGIVGLRGTLSDITAAKTVALDLVRQARELSIINDLAREMGARLSVESALATAVEHVARAVNPDVAMIFLRDGEHLIRKNIHSPVGLTVAEDAAVHRVGDCLCGLTVKTGGPVYSRDIHTDLRCTRQECKQAGFRSFAALPLIGGGEIIGTIGLAAVAERDFEEQTPYLEALSNEIAVGLNNALLYEQAQADALELRARLTRIQEAEAEQARLSAQLQQAARMEAIGTLAGGIAHDFNNVLTPIIMGAEMMLETLPESGVARSLTEKIMVAGERAKDLVSQILTFSRQSDLERKPLALTPLVKEAVKLARASLPSTIEIRQSLHSEDDLILANPTQVHQVVMNLITNAAHAMRGKGGVLEIALQDVCLTQARTTDLPELPSGSFVLLIVSDTGSGMDGHTLQQIFDPFFTTKKRGEGTGLGLSIVHGIVRSYDGAIQVDSEVGSGTVFTVYLPSLPRVKTLEREEATQLPRGRERILLVDDEADIVDVTAQMLDHLGYRVEATTDALKALEDFRKTPNGYDLVITDLTMPKLTGDKLALEIKHIRPDIPVILCSGYQDQIEQEEIVRNCVSAFLNKPIGRNLAAVIREVLSETAADR